LNRKIIYWEGAEGLKFIFLTSRPPVWLIKQWKRLKLKDQSIATYVTLFCLLLISAPFRSAVKGKEADSEV
jgi:hypothetical protein